MVIQIFFVFFIFRFCHFLRKNDACVDARNYAKNANIIMSAISECSRSKCASILRQAKLGAISMQIVRNLGG